MTTKILIIRFSSIGDIVLTSPVIRCIKNQISGVEIHFLTKSKFKPVVEGNPNIDKVFTYDDKLSSVLEELNLIDYSYIIDLHNNFRSIYVKAKLRSFSFTVNKINFKKWLVVNLKVNKLPNKHIVDRYLETIRPLGVFNDFLGLDYFIPKGAGIDFSLIPISHQSEYVVVSIGGTYQTKRLPTEKLIELCASIKKPIFILGGPDDAETAGKIKSSIGERVYNGCGVFSLNESASVIEKSALVVTHDTGLMHIASAYKKIVFSIWGNTIPEFGMYPYLPHKASKIFEVQDLKCRPCSKLGFEKCPKKHFHCMNRIDINQIATEINTFH